MMTRSKAAMLAKSGVVNITLTKRKAEDELPNPPKRMKLKPLIGPFPEEIWDSIFSYFDICDIIVGLFVCRVWNATLTKLKHSILFGKNTNLIFDHSICKVTTRYDFQKICLLGGYDNLVRWALSLRLDHSWLPSLDSFVSHKNISVYRTISNPILSENGEVIYKGRSLIMDDIFASAISTNDMSLIEKVIALDKEYVFCGPMVWKKIMRPLDTAIAEYVISLTGMCEEAIWSVAKYTNPKTLEIFLKSASSFSPKEHGEDFTRIRSLTACICGFGNGYFERTMECDIYYAPRDSSDIDDETILEALKCAREFGFQWDVRCLYGVVLEGRVNVLRYLYEEQFFSHSANCPIATLLEYAIKSKTPRFEETIKEIIRDPRMDALMNEDTSSARHDIQRAIMSNLAMLDKLHVGGEEEIRKYRVYDVLLSMIRPTLKEFINFLIRQGPEVTKKLSYMFDRNYTEWKTQTVSNFLLECLAMEGRTDILDKYHEYHKLEWSDGDIVPYMFMHEDTMKWALERGCPLPSGYGTVRSWLLKENLRVIRYLLEKGYKLHESDFIIDKSVPPCWAHKTNLSLFELCCKEKDCLSTVSLILEAGYIWQKDDQNVAYQYCNLETIQSLEKLGLPEPSQKSVSDFAVKNKDDRVIKYLKSKLATTVPTLNKALLNALECDAEDAAKFLLRCQIVPSEYHVLAAARNCNLDLLQMLINKGAPKTPKIYDIARTSRNRKLARWAENNGFAHS